MAAVLLALAASTAEADPAWSTYAVKNGITLQRRRVESGYYDLRASLVVDAPPAAVEEAIWSMITADAGPNVAKREVLARSPREVVVYDRVHTPVVSNRDVTVRIRKVPRTDGKIEVQFESRNDLGPPPRKGYVRIPVVRGSWTVEPRADGKSQLSYQCYSEAGGLVPPALVRGAQQDQIHNDVQRMLAQLRRQAPR
jgi:hypothetical protein